jgi:TatA/E family protein of Tat protein translocase
MIANLAGSDLIFVIIIAVIVLGAGSQLPKIARNVGSAGREFRKAQQEAEDEAAKERADKAQQASVPPPVPLPPTTPAAPAPAAPAAAAEPTINLTPAQLDALLKAREEQVRNEATPGN